MADLLLRLSSTLEAHCKNADSVTCVGARDGFQTGLRLLKSQEAGMVLLSQELVGCLLACSFFCLFPFCNRGANHLRMINFDRLFASLRDNYNEKQENKIKCIIHYFERICSSMPIGNVSFERKVLAVDQTSNYIPYPKAESWSKSVIPLCPFEVYTSGLIEDQLKEALEVDFANKYLGGGALNKACVQALRPFVVYYTFGLEALQSLDQVTKWITSNGWSVGDLWNMIVEYSSQRSKKKTKVGFFQDVLLITP